jgi:peptidoglycan/xylan/chitin deacetylase (PgdA/CDA1 family)
MNNKPMASLSLDLDNKWSYLKTHGDSAWETFPSYFDVVVPRFLSFFEDRNLKITVFVVGQDAALEKNHAALASIAEDGHEIGNHSFHHEPWLQRYTPAELERDFERSDAVIRSATGQQPVGFRGPGFSLSNEVLRVLVRRGYKYDCSTFPTFLGPIARAYYFFKSRLSREEKEDRKELFGTWKDGFESNDPFVWTSSYGKMVEVPVTTMPFFKVPIHGSYVLYLAGYSMLLAKAYFAMALKMCVWAGVQPSILLHPLDFMGKEDDSDLSFFPAMNLSAQKKVDLLSDCIAMMTRQFNVVTMQQHVASLRVEELKPRSVDTAAIGVTGELAESKV